MQLTLSRQGTYALRAVCHLAVHPLELRKRRQIAEATRASSRTLANVLAQLGRAGVVDATAGPHGGYRLSRAASEVTVLEVIQAVEGELANRVCPLREDACDGSCSLHPSWKGAQDALLGLLASTTLQDVVNGNGRVATAA